PGCDTLGLDIMPMPFNNDFTVFPNPTSSYCVVQTGTPIQSEASIQLFSANGALIKTFVMQAGNISATLSLENIPLGIYFIQVIQKEGTNTMMKLMVD
ncbi:MAG: T9SS type A sorting domain-containing protein, partial [Chitinophagales bacterium]